MLDDRLAGAERPGNGCHAAFGDWKQRVDNALAGDERHVGGELALIGAADADGPALHQRDFLLGAVGRLDHSNGIGDGEIAGADRFDGSDDTVGDHDLVQDDLRLLNRAKDVAGRYLVAHFGGGSEGPFFIAVKRRNFDAACEAVADFCADFLQRALDTVVDIGNQSRSKLNAHRDAGRFHRLARSKPRGFLVNLDRSLVAVDLDDLADETLFADAHNVKHVGVAHSLGDDQRAGYFFDLTNAHIVFSPALLLIAVENDIGANSLLHRFFDVFNAHPRVAGYARNRDDGREALGAVAVDFRFERGRERLGDIDYRIFALSQLAQPAGSLGRIGDGEGVQSERGEAVNAVAVPDDCCPIHTFPLPFPGSTPPASRCAYRKG